MVTASDLKMASAELGQIFSKLALSDSEEDEVDYFASLAWAVICEPGDAFAGQLTETFGAARALALELARTSAKDYVAMFADAGSDWLEMQKFGRFEKTLADARERWTPRLSTSNVRAAVDAMAAANGWFITQRSQHFPLALRDLNNHAPRGLFGIGKPTSGADRAISVVGSRVSTPYGERATSEIVSPMVGRGYAVVSGGAYGIDRQAHRSTLALGGFTISVMAGGLDKLYPSGNKDLFHEISEHGLLISEMPPEAEPTKWRFLQRNRLIAAMGEATILVEANARSGAVSTANRAADLGRPVGAVPGPIDAPGSDGCHQLIRDFKAQLVTCADDILEMLGMGSSAPELAGLGALETRVLDVIGLSAADLVKIRTEGGLTQSETEIGIAGLSLLGLIEKDAKGWRRKL